MEKRNCERIPASIEITYCLWNPLFWKKIYDGTIENISEKGMFISTKTSSFPLDSLLEISIQVNKTILFIPVKNNTIVWKSVLPDNSCDGMGIELSDPPRDYLEFIEGIKAALEA